MSVNAPERESLPFDVEREGHAAWVYVTFGLVIVIGILVGAGLVPMLAFVPFLVASALGRRFASSATHVEVDENGLELGGRSIGHTEILDVWVDLDEIEPRATVAIGQDAELAVLHFANREQARRFGEALATFSDDRPTVVAGYNPRFFDALASVRFVAVAIAFAGTGAWYGLFALAFFAVGARMLVLAKQVVVQRSSLEIRTLFGTRVHAYSDIERVDVQAGIVGLRNGEKLRIGRFDLCDTTLSSPAWLERARTRALEHMRERLGARPARSLDLDHP